MPKFSFSFLHIITSRQLRHLIVSPHRPHSPTKVGDISPAMLAMQCPTTSYKPTTKCQRDKTLFSSSLSAKHLHGRYRGTYLLYHQMMLERDGHQSLKLRSRHNQSGPKLTDRHRGKRSTERKVSCSPNTITTLLMVSLVKLNQFISYVTVLRELR